MNELFGMLTPFVSLPVHVILDDRFLLFQAKYDAACLEREDTREQNSKMQTEICDLKENLDSVVASNKIEVCFNAYFV